MARVFACHNPYAPDFFVSNMMRMPFFDLDFGLGRPYHVTMPVEMAPRIAYVLPTADGAGCEVLLSITKRMAQKLALTGVTKEDRFFPGLLAALQR